jgi:hypothetical protein
MRLHLLPLVMAGSLTVLSVSCAHRDRSSRRDEPAAREAGREAYRASQEVKRDAKKAAKELKNAGKNFREGWSDARRQHRDQPNTREKR